jgi:RNA 2',3'-cyclic 3'-phosphodiesterase
VRLFVALEAPGAWRSAAAAVQRALVDALPEPVGERLRLVDPALMHLTIRFLGEVDEGGVDMLQAALDGHVEPFALDLALAAAGTFGPSARTSVAWLALDGDVEGLRSLAGRVEQAVGLAGLPPEKRPFAPHLTLGRVHRSATKADRQAIAAAVAVVPPPPACAVTLAEVLLVRSHLGGSSPRYEVLSRHG